MPSPFHLGMQHQAANTHLIPRRIIQTARTRELSPIAKAAVTNIKLLHPDWEYLFFDDADIQHFIKTEFPEYTEIFKSFARPIQRIDFFRYLAVYRFGGFYFDLDVFFSTELSPLLTADCVFPFEELTVNRHLRNYYSIDWELGNYAFGSIAGHPFLKAIIENCIRAQKDPKWLAPMLNDFPRFVRPAFHVLNSTGPGLITRTYADNPDLQKSITILFPDDVCNERRWHQFGIYAVHVMDGSWRNRGNLLWRKAALWWEAGTRRALLRESVKLGPTRSKHLKATV